MNEKILKPTLFGILIIVILTSNFIPFSADVYLRQLIGKYLSTPLFAEQSWTNNINDEMNPDNYVSVSTEDEDEDGPEFDCNKLLDICPDQTDDQTNVPATESDEISERYLEQGPSTNVSVTPPAAFNLSQPESTETGSAQDNLQVYENPTLGVKISYPMEWNQVENQTNRYSVLTFTSPQENSQGTSQEKFLIRINNEPTDMSLDEYTDNINESMQKNSNFQVTGSNSTTLSNNPASSVTGILKEGDKNLQVLDEWTIKDGKVYRIVFYSDPDNADSFQPAVQKILESFSITK
jgi:PsbP-like protein